MATTVITQVDQQTTIELSDNNGATQHGRSPTPQPITDNERTVDRVNGISILKLVSAGYAFFVAGVNDGSLGPLIPYVIRDYNITTSIVSSVYGGSFLGWLVAALSNTHLSARFDRGVMLALGASFQILSQALRMWKPPFALYIVTFFITTLGQGFQDTHANAFVAEVKTAHRWLGFIHAMYTAGCLVGPFVSTAVASVDANGSSPWSWFYAFPFGLGVINLTFTLVAFWDGVRITPRTRFRSSSSGPDETSTTPRASFLIISTFRTPSFWLLSLFFFFYLGSTLTASGWVVEYLVTVRHGDISKMGYISAGYSGGALLGRLLLVEPIARWGERWTVFACCVLAIAFQLLFWLVPNIIAASVAVSLFGLFTGPFFPVGVSVGSKLFPNAIRSTALAFMFVIAQIGGSLFPIVTGVIASHAGVGVLQPILVGLLVATLVSWLLVPRPKSSGNLELHQE